MVRAVPLPLLPLVAVAAGAPIAIAIGYAAGGNAGMAAASITSAVALAYFGIGEGVNHFCRRSQTGWGLGISMASTVFRLLGIAGLLWWMGRSGVFDDAAQRLGMAVAVAVAVAARAAGECLGEIRRRVPAIDYQPPADWMERA